MSSLVLTAEQERIVRLTDGCHLVVAPPGSGKTEVLAQRVVRLLQSSRTEDFNVLALSFTKNAAGSMRQRVSERLGEVSGRVNCTTYHAFCLDILRHYGNLIDIPRELTVYDLVDDRIEALAQGLVDEGFIATSDDLHRSVAIELLDQISRQKRSLILPEAVPPSSDGTIKLRDAYRAYNLALAHNGALDFDTVLVETYRLLTEHPKVARHYRLIYRHILVDEAQDTSLAQYEILKAICGSDHRNVFMVADPAQSIYGFSGASSRFIDRFAEEFGATRHELTITFRCAQAIVDVAAKLFVPGKRSRSSPLAKTHALAKGLVWFEVFPNEAEEARAAIDWAESLIEEGLPRGAVGPKEDPEIRAEHIAILARSRIHLRATLSELDERGVPYHFAAGGDGGVFDSDHYRILLYGLKLLANPRDVATGKTLWITVRSLDQESLPGDHEFDDEPLPAKLFSALANQVRESILESPLRTLAQCAARQCDVTRGVEELLRWNLENGEDSALSELIGADREFLAQRWTGYKSAVDRKDRTWQGLLMELLNKPKPEAPGVRILTVHAAKGLEFRAVSVVGLNEGAFPDFRNAEGDALESEQRLAYVAVTRAARVLRFSRPMYRQTRYGPRLQEESRFIAMAELSATP
jgi:DNA helicase-2/ATP-dependent DNA helicase PcrA